MLLDKNANLTISYCYILGNHVSEDIFDYKLLDGSVISAIPKHVYKCTQCDYVTKRKDTFRRYQQVHSGERPYQCRYCFKLFSRKDNLKVHLTSFHSSENINEESLSDNILR